MFCVLINVSLLAVKFKAMITLYLIFLFLSAISVLSGNMVLGIIFMVIIYCLPDPD